MSEWNPDSDNYAELVNAIMDADRAGVPMEELLKAVKRLDAMPNETSITVDCETEEQAEDARGVICDLIRISYARRYAKEGTVDEKIKKGVAWQEWDPDYESIFRDYSRYLGDYDPAQDGKNCPINRVHREKNSVIVEDCWEMEPDIKGFSPKRLNSDLFQIACFTLAALYPDRPFEALLRILSCRKGLVEYTAAVYKDKTVAFRQYGGDADSTFRITGDRLLRMRNWIRWKYHYYGKFHYIKEEPWPYPDVL